MFKLISDNFPIIVINNFEVIDDDLNNKLITNLLLDKKINDRFRKITDINTRILNDEFNFYKNLYEKFCDLSLKLFGDFKISPNNSKTPWAYISTIKNHIGLWHNHIRTSTINSVYYLNPCGGSISFRGSLNDEIVYFEYFPKKYDLIIFPDYLDHKPNFVGDSNDTRVSINLEIITTEYSNKHFSTIFKDIESSSSIINHELFN